MRISTPALCLALIVFLLCPGMAAAAPDNAQQEAVTQSESQPEDQGRKQTAENPYQNKLRVEALALSKSLGEAELAALNKLRIGFGMVRAVRITQETVGKAVPLCAKANPDMSEEITARHAAWEEAVGPALAEAEQDMNDALESGIFTEPAAIREYLDVTDKAARFADGQSEERVVTTPEACQSLLQSMSTTEEQLAGILETIEWPRKEAVSEKAESATEEPAAAVEEH